VIGRLRALIYRLNKRLILMLPLVLAASLFLPSQIVPSVRAAGFTGTGLVCVTASVTATNCSNSAPSIGPLTVGSIFRVGVFVNNSKPMGGFEIYVKNDPTFLQLTGANLGTLIVSPSFTSICINGSAQTGSCTTGTANGPGVVEVTTIESSGTNECGGIAPCSGMAFSINYTVVGATPTTSLSYPTATGCSTSSVSSPPNTCVLVDDAVGTTLPENIRGATVTIAFPPAVVCITSPATGTSCPVGRPQIPVTFGSTFAVGVFIQSSQPMGGFDIYVSVDPHFLNPTNATLGTLIASPSLTTRCVNGRTLEGACTIGMANSQGIVEVSTIESSGSNECAAAPCSGLAFTILYSVLGVTPTTPIGYPTALGCSTSSVSSPLNECVLLASNIGTTLPEIIQGADVIQSHPVDPTSISKSCVPSPVVVGRPTTCAAIVNDVGTSGRIPPVGQVTWSTDGSGSFNPNVCTLSSLNASASECVVFYMPTLVGTGIHHISVIYPGDTIHSGSTDPFSLSVVKTTVSIATAVIVDQTGQPPSSGGVPVGFSVHDNIVFLGGYPVTGAPGTVTYTLYPNSGCTAGTGTVVSAVNVGASDNVLGSASVTPSTAGSYSFNAVYSGDGNNNVVTSACEPFTVIPAPSLTHIHWTHHLSLSKTLNTQSWTVTVANPLSTSVSVVVRIVASSAINPSLSFDVTCGVTCVNTDPGGVNFTPGLTPVSVAAGASSFSFSFSQPISGNFVNQKVSFTVTVYWATGTLYTHGNSKSGAFAVVP
jgi:hypothetical protein